MSRPVQTRWIVKATLEAIAPLHVGGMGANADTDLALTTDGRGRYYIPGTSLAGALRGWMGVLLDEDTKIKDLWGDHQSEHRGASFITIDDAEIIFGKGQTVEIREGVGIDRQMGAAAERYKYSRAILPKGCRFPLHITLDSQAARSPDELWQLLQALEYGHIRFGAAKTRGLGRVKLTELIIHRQELSDPDGIFDTLIRGGSCEDWEIVKQANNYRPPAQLTFKVGWQPQDPVMVKAEGEGIAVDILPLVSQVETGLRLVIPGSSIKGALRTQAERIVRTVRYITPSSKLIEQLSLPLIDILFGSAEKKQASRQSGGKIGVLSVDDCYASIPISTTDWLDVENAPKLTTPLENALKNALDNCGEPFHKLQPAMHVAVDRWTGGAADGMLYSVLEPVGMKWEAIGLHVDFGRLQKFHSDIAKAVLALLFLVLRDFANRKIPIGYGTNRGMGTIEVNESIEVSGFNIPDLEMLEGNNELKSDLSDLDSKLQMDLNAAWQSWIEKK